MATPQPEPAHSAITREPIDARAVIARVQGDANGAVITFAGIVRNHNGGRSVDGITYECYHAMAERVLDAVVADARERFEVRATAVHRVGDLTVGDVSLFVAVASAHRAEAFAATEYIVAQIKRRVPIWKKEHYCDGESGWVGS